MTDTPSILFYILMLILPIGALVARRLPIGATIKMALAWLAIFAVGFVLVSLWQGSFGGGTPAKPARPSTDINLT